jgi:general secretion pathway protein A
MYEAFFGFKEKPFSLLPDPGFLYLGKRHSMALTMLQYGLMNQAGFTVIAGEVGCGKTTLIRYLLNHIDQDITVGLISNTQREIGELLQWVLFAFNLEYRHKAKVELYETFVNFIIDEYARKKRTVLIIDEAQNMSSQTLEELRMLSNINADKHQVLQLILVGQPELRNTLRRPELVQFAQRIAVDYYLNHLDSEETREYIYHRITVAGGDNSLFTSEACELVYEASNGIPRLINTICDTAFVYALAEQKEAIDTKLMKEVIREKFESTLFSSQEKDRQSKRLGHGGVQRPVEDLEQGQLSEFSKDAAREIFAGLRKKK